MIVRKFFLILIAGVALASPTFAADLEREFQAHRALRFFASAVATKALCPDVGLEAASHPTLVKAANEAVALLNTKRGEYGDASLGVAIREEFDRIRVNPVETCRVFIAGLTDLVRTLNLVESQPQENTYE